MTTDFHFDAPDADAALPVPKRRGHPEWTLQTACYVWASKFVDGPFLWLSIDRGVASEMQKLREAARGFRAGTPDVLLLIPGLAVFQELKAPGGWISDHQHAMAGMIDRAGHKWFVAHSVAEFGQNCARAGIALRALALEYARAADEKLALRAARPPAPPRKNAPQRHAWSKAKVARARARGVMI